MWARRLTGLIDALIGLCWLFQPTRLYHDAPSLTAAERMMPLGVWGAITLAAGLGLLWAEGRPAKLGAGLGFAVLECFSSISYDASFIGTILFAGLALRHASLLRWGRG